MAGVAREPYNENRREGKKFLVNSETEQGGVRALPGGNRPAVARQLESRPDGDGRRIT